MTTADPSIYQRPVELLRNLIRFDTTNPPGNEVICIDYIDELLNAAGFETQRISRTPDRPNLITRLQGAGSAPPLLIQGHLDVVTTENQDWDHPPFSGDLSDGYVWGRGALDMKSGVTMILAALLRAKAEGFTPAGDLLVIFLSDEEAGGSFGAKFLAQEHPQLFEGIAYGIGEFGGFPLYVGDKKFYLIQVAEKRGCSMTAYIRGPGGHGAFPLRDGAMAKLGYALQQLNDHRLPVHITPVVQQMLGTMADALSGPFSDRFKRLLDPAQSDVALDEFGPAGRFFDPMLHHTVSATIVRGGSKINVIPSEIQLQLDGRFLPGFSHESFMDELHSLIGDDIELEVTRLDPKPIELDMGLFELLSDILKEADPDGISVPLLMPGATDGRYFAQVGVQPYGFLPMNLPPDFNFLQTVHAANERIPVDALQFGVDAVYQLLTRYGTDPK